MKYLVQVVKNGYILKIIDYGQPLLKEPYTKEVYVFHSFEDMNKLIAKLVKEYDNVR